ncbi:hypothetical protein [Roseateles chitinivorans]|uniref:hypothetical protein n=1 Tax=Roseateles chitinivorans TaxID=2917965 RepID=UPI003D678ABA
MTTKIGYVIDIPVATGNTAFQVINEADAVDNLAVIAAVRSSSTDACSPGGVSVVLVIDLNTGATTKITVGFPVDEVRIIAPPPEGQECPEGVQCDGRPKVLIQGKPTGEPITCREGEICCSTDCAVGLGATGAGAGRLINWREIPLRN